MSLTYGFYNSINEDRKYNASQMSKLFDGVLNDGIFMSIGDKFMVTANSGMNVSVGTGRAWFDHTWTLNDSILVLPVAASELLLNRIDTVVLEVNNTEAVRANSIKIVHGGGATVPVPPTLVNTSEIHQYPLAHIYVGVGVTEIIAANITNKVGTSETPFATGVMQTMSIDALIAQWQGEWDNWSAVQQADYMAWFNNINSLLGTEPATNLQIQINAITAPPSTKITPVDADFMLVADSVEANVIKKSTWANIKTALKTYFDTLYNNYVHPTTSGNKHIPAGGAANQVLKYSANGTAVWGTDNDTIYTHPTVEKTTPVDADSVAISDSAASGAFKKLTWSNIKARLQTYFDTVYAFASHTHKYAGSASVGGAATLAKFLEVDTAYSFVAAHLPRDYSRGLCLASVSAEQGYPNYGTVIRAASFGNDGGVLELFIPFSPDYGGTRLRYRLGKYDNAGFTDWKTLLDTDAGEINAGFTVNAATLILGRQGGVNRGSLYNDGVGIGFLTNTGSWAAFVPFGTNNFIVNGAITAGGNITAYSDERLKSNIKTIPNALAKVLALRGVEFDKDGAHNIGVIAQEVQKVIPEVVLEGVDEMKTLSVAYGNLVGLLIEGMKEQQKQIDELKAKVM